MKSDDLLRAAGLPVYTRRFFVLKDRPGGIFAFGRGIFEDDETHPDYSWHISLCWLWRFGSHHGYYDGPNCTWKFGPISFYTNMRRRCRKCGYPRLYR